MPKAHFLIIVLAYLGLCFSAQAQRTAVWIRPPSTSEQLEATLVAAKRAGFTDVLLEGFYHGRSIWPSGVVQNRFAYDALQHALEVSRREGLALSVWMETLYWCPPPQYKIPCPLWQDALATRDAANRTSLQAGGLGLVSPAFPEVGATLEALVRELATRYPEVGLHLDYLRYPRETHFGYEAPLLERFREQTGLDARRIEQFDDQGNETLEWRQWTALRAQAITDLAGRLIGSYRDSGGRGPVTAAVYALRDPLQDWRSWPGLEAAYPMIYVKSLSLLRLALLPFGRPGNVWPGVQVGDGYPGLEEQLKFLHDLGYPNVGVFGWTP
ncbi:uncharacterized lipoprotein YddW (UPF0748 family) [Deinobacterium chartae]|uniref:Uncharacterized lipoprotein YddW (UPF0748 family) n=1 Tax=Deinobacterium chartae TaxID=521158 RepID=A0A841I1H6_9DEIO|nr:family 10 glycosylhydrolase [Deinobacterium chartae]MBB6098280.1 uncharacterized lipoprotein YddW (UPF0748 family) [Deinobacterium chartae]